MNSCPTRKAGSAARAHRPSSKTLALALLAGLALTLGSALLGTAAAADGGTQAATAASAPDLLWMSGGHAGGVGRAALSPDGQTLATADYAEVLLWRYADGRLVGSIGAPWIDAVKCIRFSADGQ